MRGEGKMRGSRKEERDSSKHRALTANLTIHHSNSFCHSTTLLRY